MKDALFYLKGFLDDKHQHDDATCQLMNGFGNDDECTCGAEAFYREAQQYVQQQEKKDATESGDEKARS